MTQSSTVIVPAQGIDHLEWLKFTFTQGMARPLVENSLLGTPGFERFRYATKTETASLLRSYYGGIIDSSGNAYWQPDAAPAAQNFLADFGNTRVRFYLPGQTLDVGNGSVAYDLLRYAYFYCGAYDVDIERNLDPPVTMVGSVGQALNGINSVAVHFTYGGLRGIVYPPNPTAYPPGPEENNYSSLLVRECLAGPSAPTGLKITE